MKQRLYLSLSLWSVLAGAGCAQLLGIENSSAGSPDGSQSTADGPSMPPVGDGPGGNTTACGAPLPSFGPVRSYGIADAVGFAVGDVIAALP